MNYTKDFKNLILEIEKKKEKEKKVLFINKIIFFVSTRIQLLDMIQFWFRQ